MYTDKIVQLGLKKILEAEYEPKFRENMYGFCPHRNCHMAIKDMSISIIRKRNKKVYQALKERLSKYGLEIEPSKSRLLEFGRYEKERRKSKGLGKPETFDFLGFIFLLRRDTGR